MRRTRLVVAAGVLAAAAVPVVVFGIANATSAPPKVAAAGVDAGWYGAAAYVMPLENNPPDLSKVMAATGQKTFELAFVLAGGGCTPAWDGTAPVASDTAVASVVSTVRAAGGDVSISAGGYGGRKLGEACSSPETTAAAYQQVITKYSIKAIDFDLEEPEYENATAIANELGAAKILQKDNPGLYVSVTTAASAAGTGWFGTEMLKQAKAIGFTPVNYSIMPFDGGFNGAAAQISALEAFHGILMSTFGWDSATAYAHEGVSMMNGRSDTGEIFKQADFEAVLDYATEHHLSRYTYWSVNRDRACPGGANETTSGTCSSIAQSDWEFTKFTARFGGAAPQPSTTASSSPRPSTTQSTSPRPTPTGSSGTVPASPKPSSSGGGACPTAWDAATAYTSGAKVGYGGHVWTARWWTYNDKPGGPAGVWSDDGPC